MIGSITKAMTTMLAAALVDDGGLSWDTRLVDVLPQFVAGDRTMSERLTVRDAFCNCAGLPGRDLERYFKTGRLSPEETLTALADIAPAASFGEQFIYNNLLVAAGGYAAGVAARGDEAGDGGFAYDAALQQRVLSPIGMKRSTFYPEAVRADGDYALPHAADLSGELRPHWHSTWPRTLPPADYGDLGAEGGGSEFLWRPAGDGRVDVRLWTRLDERRVPRCASHQPYRRHDRLDRPGCIPPAADLGIAFSNASASPGALAFTFAVHFHVLPVFQTAD